MLLEHEGVLRSLDTVDDNGQTAFHWVCKQGNSKSAELLLDAGCNVAMRTSDGSTALMLAAQQGDEAVVQALLAEGAKEGINNKDTYGYTALMRAAQDAITIEYFRLK